MRHLQVTDSDIIESIGFDHSSFKGLEFGAMEVVFKSSPDVVYRYDQVKTLDFVALVAADSIGKTFHEKFRKTKHPFTKSQRSPTLKK